MSDSRYDLDCGHVKIEFDPPSLVSGVWGREGVGGVRL